MRALFVNPPNQPFTDKQLLIEPIDILSLASYVQKLGHEVKVLDMDVQRLKAGQAKACLQEFLPEVLIIPFDYHIPLHTSESLGGVFEIARQARMIGAKVVVGGKLATYFPEKLLYAGSPIDVAVSGEMEASLAGLLGLDNWQMSKLAQVPGISFWAGEGLQKTEGLGHFDLDRLPIPDRSLVDLADYIDVRTLLSSRGCSMKCAFCSTPGFWGGWRGRKPRQVVEEIVLLVNDYDAKRILFLDDNALFDKNRMEMICQLIIDRQIKVSLGCLATINCFDEATMKLMYQAGFRWIHYGAESGSNEALDNINKMINRELIREVISKTRKIGYRVRTSWIIDLPGVTEQALAETIGLILDTQADEIRLHYLTLRLGSTIFGSVNIEGEIPGQYIHNSVPNQNFTAVSKTLLAEKVSWLISELARIGYIVIKEPQDLKRLSGRESGKTRVVSFCPLKYDIGW